MAEVRVAKEKLLQFAQNQFERRGVEPSAACALAQALIETSLRGVDTHGIRLLPIYLRQLDSGKCEPRPTLEATTVGPSLCLLDAHRSLGLHAGLKAVTLVKELATQHGIGLVLIRNSSHFGAASSFSLPLARAGFLGFACSNTDALMAPWGGRRPLFGTNPIAFAAAGDGDDVFSLDMATSQTAFSRIGVHAAAGLPLEPGWALDKEGNPTLDGTLAATLLPLGGPKGQGLSMMVQVLCALLSNSPLDSELEPLYSAADPQKPHRVSQLIAALDVSRFTDVGDFRRRLSQLMAQVRSQSQSGETVAANAGDFEAECARVRAVEGIPLSAELVAELSTYGDLVP